MTRILQSLVPSSLVVAIALAGPTPTASQEPADTFRLDELVVTATRLALPRAWVPAAVTVLRGEDLRARGVRFVADALREVPGATVVRNGSHGGITSLFLRGGESDYVQVMIDGVVVNEPGGAVDLGQLTTGDVERIEVVRGPTSVLYGSEAVTGVVHILTHRGAAGARLTAGADLGIASRVNGDSTACPGYPEEPCPSGADLGSYTTRGWQATLSGASGLLGYSLGASGFDSEGAYAFNNDYRNRTLGGALQVRGDAGDMALTLRHTDGRFHYPTDGAGRLVDADQHRTSESLAFGLEGGRFLSPRVEARATLSYHAGDHRTVDEPDSPADTLGFFASRSTSRIDRRKADLRANVRASAGATATLGVELERQHGESEFSSESEFGPFESSTRNDRSNRAAYAQLLATPAPALGLTAGARAERNDRFGTFVTWRAGANLRLSPETTVRVSAGTAFKEPTFFENYAEGFVRGNPGLEPEESRSWEVGVERGFASGLAGISAAWFDQRFRNLIQFHGQAQQGEPSYVNVGEASSRGLELEARVGRPGGPSASASWVRLDTEVLDEGLGVDALFQRGQRLVRRPRDRFNLTAAAPLGERARAGAKAVVVGARDDLNFVVDPGGARVGLPGHTVVDVFAEYGLVTGGTRDVTLHVRIENLLDRDYQEVVNFPSPGRALFVGLRAGTGF